MVHRIFIKKVGYNADEFSGFAGMGVERSAMLRHGIKRIAVRGFFV